MTHQVKEFGTKKPGYDLLSPIAALAGVSSALTRFKTLFEMGKVGTTSLQ